MKRAIISDIHGNLEALQAVMAHIADQQVDEIFCLGDIVGYGPNPCECLDLVIASCKVGLLGNHDQGAMFDPEGFNSGAERAIFWTREQLENSAGDRDQIDRRWDFLGTMPRIHRDDPWLYVHGSPRNPVNEYVFPEDIYNQKKMEKLFGLINKGCFQGHTHVPGVFLESLEFITPEQVEHVYRDRARAVHGERRLGGPAARRRPAVVLYRSGRRQDYVPPRRIRLGGDGREDLPDARLG